MGYMVELNALLGLPSDFDVNTLKVGESYTVEKKRERAFPRGIAMLIVDKDWNFYGYCQAKRAMIDSGKTTITFEVISLFDEEQREIYKENFVKAAKATGEISN